MNKPDLPSTQSFSVGPSITGPLPSITENREYAEVVLRPV